VTVKLPLLPPAYRLISHDTIGSTNDEAKRLAHENAPAGTLVWALEQTAGRGRRGRFWSSPRGNLYVSLILRPACPPDRAAQLGFVAALAVGDALLELVPRLEGLACKWPNDVLVAGRKIAGILLESEMGKAEKLGFLIVGVGVNLVCAPSMVEFSATSVADEGYPSPTPQAALETFARRFEAWAQRWRMEGFGPVRDAWRSRAVAIGEQIKVRLDNATLQGKFIDIDQQGTLLLETEHGLRRISAGDVFPVR
jgi:BirA family transcriptional regulator, biotin operon repressor / biotin---[acetyl-CoA-carboxylase] ligase